jgi:hypothetical protein
MITKEFAAGLHKGKTLYHATATNADGTAKRCRINGKLKMWVTRPNEFRIPVKHGLWDCFYITQDNAKEWLTYDRTEQKAA